MTATRLGTAARHAATDFAVAAAGLPAGGIAGQVPMKDSDTSYDVSWATPSAGSVAWGAITGTLASQTDLAAALAAKQNALAAAQSVAIASGVIALVNDSTSPGATMLYGTNSAGVKGWYTQPSGGGGDSVAWGAITGMLASQGDLNTALVGKQPVLTATQSVAIASNAITLVNDTATPGGSMLYGTNPAGVKGWYTQPSGGGGGPLPAFIDSLVVASGYASLVNDTASPAAYYVYSAGASGTRGWHAPMMGGGLPGQVWTCTSLTPYSEGWADDTYPYGPGHDAMFRGLWSPTAAYITGDTVLFNGIVYGALAGQIGQEPDINQAVWQQITSTPVAESPLFVLSVSGTGFPVSPAGTYYPSDASGLNFTRSDGAATLFFSPVHETWMIGMVGLADITYFWANTQTTTPLGPFVGYQEPMPGGDLTVTELGQIGLPMLWLGEFNTIMAYPINSVVTYSGHLFISIAAQSAGSWSAANWVQLA
jgi:hypothetical protein